MCWQGSKQAGFFGAVVATAAVVAPSFLIILLLIALLKNALKNQYVQAILQGLKPCVIGIVLATGINMIVRNMIVFNNGVNVQAAMITAILAIVMFGYKRIKKKKLSPIILIILSAVIGAGVYGI